MHGNGNWLMCRFPRSVVGFFFSLSLTITMVKYVLHAVYVPRSAVLTFCNPAWIHIKCDCIHQHLPGSAVVWLSVFNLLKCTLAFFHDIESLKLALSWHHVWGSDFHWHEETHISLSYWCYDFKVIELSVPVFFPFSCGCTSLLLWK